MPQSYYFEFEYGTGSTRSGYPIRKIYWFLFPDSNEWINIFDIDEYDIPYEVIDRYYSSTKYFTKIRVALPVGTVVRYYDLYRKPPALVKYFIVTEDGQLKEIPYDIVDIEEEELECGNKLIKRVEVVDVNGRKIEFLRCYFIKGPLGKYVRPSVNRDEVINAFYEVLKEFGCKKPVATLAFCDLIVRIPFRYERRDELKTLLKELGFRWDWGAEGYVFYDFLAYPEDFIEYILLKLEENGVDTSEVRKAIPQNIRFCLSKRQILFTIESCSFIIKGVIPPNIGEYLVELGFQWTIPYRQLVMKRIVEEDYQVVERIWSDVQVYLNKYANDYFISVIPLEELRKKWISCRGNVVPVAYISNNNLVVSGKTYPIRSELKNLGFVFNRSYYAWIYENFMELPDDAKRSIIHSLLELKVDVTPLKWVGLI